MFSFDKRFIYVIIAILAFSFLSSMTGEKLLSLVLTIPGVLVAITFHEYAHAKAADILGDETPRIQGRLNLNPFSHVDIVGLAMLIFAGFGWGNPVQINPNNFNRKMDVRKAEAIVSVAGPAMNFILALLFMIIYVAMNVFGLVTNELTYCISLIFSFGASINIGLGLFNLIPLPPLDGSKILMYFLPYNGRQWFESNQMYFYIGFIIIFVTGLSSTILSPLFNLVYNGYAFIVTKLFSIFF